jgi:histidinol-phosphate aminotransferase
MRKLLYFIFLIVRCNPISVLRTFRSKAWYSKDNIDARLKDLINQADIEPPGIVANELEKSIYRSTKRELIEKMKGLKRAGFMLTSTSGSTGEPFRFYKSKYSFLNSQKSYYDFFLQFGISRFDKNIYIGGARLKSNSIYGRIKSGMYHYLFNQKKFVSSDLQSDRDYNEVITWINAHRPKYISGFNSGLLKVAKFMKLKGVTLEYNPVLVHPTAESITAEERLTLKEAFQPKYIAMVYGATEGHFASECTEGEYHINERSCHIFEERGELIITIFDSFDLPFINYKIGDLGSVVQLKCRCGKSGPVLRNLIGRSSDFVSAGPVKITHADINMLIQQVLGADGINVRAYQLVVNKLKLLEVRVDGDIFYAKKIAQGLTERYRIDVTGSDQNIIYDSSGKKKLIVNLSEAIQPSILLENYKPYIEISQFSTTNPRVLKLDWNEGFADISQIVKSSFDRLNVSLYPDLECRELNIAAAKFYGVGVNEIASFNGSDAALNTICQSFLDSSKKFLVIAPTYGNYSAIASRYTPNARELRLNPLTFTSGEMASSLIADVDCNLVFLPNPNNPDGRYFSLEDLLRITEANKDKLIIIDQAYQEFVDGANKVDQRLISQGNVIITRTLSKAFSLAGIRVGFAMASESLMSHLRLSRDNKQVDSIAQAIATNALSNPQYMFDYVREVAEVKRSLVLFFTNNRIPYIAGEGNYILIKCKNSAEAFAKLASRGVFVRDRGSLPFLENHIRISIPPKKSLNFVQSEILDAAL